MPAHQLALSAPAGRSLNENRIQQLIEARLQASQRAVTRTVDSPPGNPPPTSPPVDVNSFEPISNGLPGVYGLGPNGYHEHPLAERRAQARQLLGFLLPFEQIALNVAAQIAHTPDLFSSEPQHTTDFFEPAYRVPGVFPLLPRFPVPLQQTPAVERRQRELAYAGNSENPYRRGMDDLLRNPARFRRRRHAFLDHLLARFGESFPRTQRDTWETLLNKELLLRHWPELSRHRACGAPLDAIHPDEACPLEQWVAHALRRDDNSTAPGAAAQTSSSRPDRFHFLVEHLLFLPDSPPPPLSSPPRPTLAVPLTHLGPVVTHVLQNWTREPLTPEFRGYVETLIRSRMGAHLVSRFLWFERPEFAAHAAAPSVTYDALDTLDRQWRRHGRPPLRLARAVDGPNLAVDADHLPAQLLAGILNLPRQESPASTAV